ncbi:MAG: DUF192 domain-containing protein [Endomicrobia bacterium]|nr:DUF192 domain-containing protein [Endomicrobiia bacterium]
MKLKFTAALLCAVFLFSGCIAAKQQPQKEEKKEEPKEVYSLPDGSVLNVKLADNDLRLVVVNSPKAKAEGLSNKDEIPEDGMIFFFYETDILSFWMKDMRFPIDIIWISGDTVVGIEKNVPIPEPGTKITDLPVYKSNEKADTVIELTAGAAEKLNIFPGSALEIQR